MRYFFALIFALILTGCVHWRDSGKIEVVGTHKLVSNIANYRGKAVEVTGFLRSFGDHWVLVPVRNLSCEPSGRYLAVLGGSRLRETLRGMEGRRLSLHGTVRDEAFPFGPDPNFNPPIGNEFAVGPLDDVKLSEVYPETCEL